MSHRAVSASTFPAAAPAGSEPAGPLPSQAPRRVILHHHIFKNAGSSIDKALADALGTRWRAFDPQIVIREVDDPIAGKLAKKVSDPDSVDADALERLLVLNPALDAISTHQGRGKYTLGPGFEKLELSLIRNPVGRALSMWRFNRRPDRQLTIDSKLVRQAGLLPFEDFIKWCVNRKQPLAPFSNYQVRLLSGNTALKGRVTYADFERASHYVAQAGCVGVVEKFEQTLAYFNRRLDAFMPGVALRSYTVNTSGGARESGDEEARQLLSKRTYQALRDANALDLALYAQVLKVGEY